MVSKFAKTSIFSAFNNPKDLTLDARAADLLGDSKRTTAGGVVTISV